MNICKACEGTGEDWAGEPCPRCKWTVEAIVKAWWRDTAYSFEQRANVILAKLLPSIWCPSCQRFSKTIEWRRHSIMHRNVADNHITCCFECFSDMQADLDERWDEYRSSQL